MQLEWRDVTRTLSPGVDCAQAEAADGVIRTKGKIYKEIPAAALLKVPAQVTVHTLTTKTRSLRKEVYRASRRAWRLARLLPAQFLAESLKFALKFTRGSSQERIRLIARFRSMVTARYLLRSGNPDFIRSNPDFTVDDLEFRLTNRWDDISYGPGVHFANDRTAYLIGLWGSGRHYIKHLMLGNIGGRAAYFRNGIALHQGPTSMIYAGHSTIKYVCRAHRSPVLTSGLLESVTLGFADLIFFYRHPFDSLLTNWFCWLTAIRNGTLGLISDVYKSTDDLCADLEQHFSGLKAFAEGDPSFLADLPKGRRFMSLPEFVEEITLFVRRATLALRLEDFSVDPVKEFSKIVDVMSADVDGSQLRLAPPKSSPYRYLEVKEKVPKFKELIEGLDAETKERIESLGYSL